MPSDYLSVNVEKTVNVVELTLPVSLDMSEIDRLNDTLLDMLSDRTGEKWVLDLSRADYMGSAMLGLMVNVRQRVKTGAGSLVLCGLSRRLMDIFETCCMERLFVIARNREDAMAVVAQR